MKKKVNSKFSRKFLPQVGHNFPINMDETKCITKEEWSTRVSQLYKSYRFDQHVSWQNHLAGIYSAPELFRVLFTLTEIVGRRVHFREITFYERSDKFSYSPDGGGRDFVDTISSYRQGNSLVSRDIKKRGVILYHKGENLHEAKRKDTASNTLLYASLICRNYFILERERWQNNMYKIRKNM